MKVERVEECVVQIVCKHNTDEDEKDILGTGFFVDKNIVVTSGHVINKYYEDDYSIYIIPLNIGVNREIKAELLKSCKEDDLVVLLGLEESFENINPLYFTKNYDINRKDDFVVVGHPEVKREIGHIQEGNVAKINYEQEANVDIYLNLDSDSKLPSYNGYSGSPFIIDEMLVGVVQEQSIAGGQALSIGVSSIEMIKQYIPNKYMIEDKHKLKLGNNIKGYTEKQIKKNIDSKKYIPSIFIETGSLKEQCRFLTNPILFYNKILEDIDRYKFIGLNRVLRSLKLDEVSIKISEELRNDITLKNLECKATELKLILGDKKRELEDLRVNLNPEQFTYETRDNIYKIKSGITDIWVIDKWLELIEMLIYRGMLITEHAGQGKTNFICDLTQNVLLKKKINTLYINAVDLVLDTIELSLERLVLNKWGYDFNTFISKIDVISKQENKPFVIVIDGLNENPNLSNFNKNLELFIENVKKYEFIRIIFTCRKELFKERFNNLQQYYCGYIKHINGLRKVDDIFNHRIYYGYVKHFDINSEQVGGTAYEKLTENTLLLRIFCETNRGKKLPPTNDIYMFDLFEAYFDTKLNQISKRYSLEKHIYINLLDKILKYMIEKNKYSKIPLTSLNLSLEETSLIEKLLDEDILFKKDQEMQQGFYKGNIEVLSFVFDEFRDYALSKYIMIHSTKYETSDYINLIKNVTHKDNEVSDGISKYLFFESKKINNTEFYNILEQQEWYKKVYSKNIFSVNDEYITDEDTERIVNAIKKDKDTAWYIIKNLLNRYDEDVFKNLGTKLLIDTIKSFNIKEYKEYISPIALSYLTKDDILYITSHDVKIYPAKHSLFKFIITICNIGYKFIDLYISYSEKYLTKSVENLEYFLDSSNNIILDNIRKIIDEMRKNIDMSKVGLDTVSKINSIYSKLPKKVMKENKTLEQLMKDILSREDD